MQTITKNIEIAKNLESNVSEWLTNAGATFIKDKQPISLGSIPIDFLVIEPFPIVIEIMGVSFFKPQNWGLKAKKILSQRITLASQYGRYIPVIAITGEENEDEFDNRLHTSLFDAVISGNKLPDFYEFIGSIKLNEFIQDILEKGEPKNFYVTETQDIEAMWNDSLNLEDLITDKKIARGTIAERFRAPFPRESVAEQLSIAAREYLSKDKSQNLDYPSSLVNNNEQNLKEPFRFRQRFETILQKEIKLRCGGEFEMPQIGEKFPHEYRFPKPDTTLIWRSLDDRGVAIKLLFAIQPSHERHKANQLIADGWMLRSLLENKIDDLLILLGTSENDNPMTYFINTLESVGWTVLPWDFAKERPLFIEFLSEEKEAFHERIAEGYA